MLYKYLAKGRKYWAKYLAKFCKYLLLAKGRKYLTKYL